MATIQGVYIALFGRPADPAGLAFFNEATNNGADLSAIGDLANTAEYQSRFTGMSNEEIITSIYQSLFGRDPEPGGLAFFVEELESGRQNINTIAINILDGATGDDALIIANKLEAANLFTSRLDLDVEVEAYVGDGAADIGRDLLDDVTSDPTTVPSESEVDAAILSLLGPDGGQEPGGGGGGGGGGGFPPPTDPDVFTEAELQAAILAANDGDTIILAPGTYVGRFVIDKDITLQAIQPDTVYIQGGFDIVNGAEDVALRGLNIETVGSGDANAAIYTLGTTLKDLELYKVEVDGNGTTRGLLLVETGAGPSDVDVVVEQSSFYDLISAIYAGVEQGNSIVVLDSYLGNNGVGIGGIGTGTSLDVHGTTLEFNSEDLGVEGNQAIAALHVDGASVGLSGGSVLLNSYQGGTPYPITIDGDYNYYSGGPYGFVGVGGSAQPLLNAADNLTILLQSPAVTNATGALAENVVFEGRISDAGFDLDLSGTTGNGATIYASDYDDFIGGTNSADYIVSNGGEDYIRGNDGNDTIVLLFNQTTLGFSGSAAANGNDTIDLFDVDDDIDTADRLDFTAFLGSGYDTKEYLSVGSDRLEDDTVAILQIDGNIDGRDFGGADFASLFGGPLSILVDGTNTRSVIIVQGDDETHVYYANSGGGLGGFVVDASEVDQVAVLTGVTNEDTFTNENFLFNVA